MKDLKHTPEHEAIEQRSLRGQVARGSAWMIAMRWCVRGLGLVSTVVLARLLTPADFGLVAMAMLVVGLLEVFCETGLQLALIRHANPTREHFDSAWTMQVLIAIGVAGCLLVVAPWVALYFGDSRVEFLVQVLSLRVILAGFENIGTVWFRRNLDFASEFRFGLYKKLLPFVVTLGLAFWLRDYWALVAGIVVGQAMGTLLSYTMHPYRPQFSLTKVREIWSFGIWILVAVMGRYLHSRVDQVVVGGVADASQLGQYSIASELAATPSTEVLEPMSRVLYPAYSKFHHEPERLRDAFLAALSMTAAIAASAATGIALVADDLVLLMLGPQWTSTGPLIVWLALGSALNGYSNSVSAVINATGEAVRNAFQSWLRFFGMLCALVVAANYTDLIGMAMTTALVSLALMPTYFMQLRRVVPVAWKDIVGVTWRPVFAAVIMTVAVIFLKAYCSDMSLILRFGVAVMIGVLVFTASQYLMWHLVGRPKGVEALVFEFALSRFSGNKAPPAPGP